MGRIGHAASIVAPSQRPVRRRIGAPDAGERAKGIDPKPACESFGSPIDPATFAANRTAPTRKCGFAHGSCIAIRNSGIGRPHFFPLDCRKPAPWTQKPAYIPLARDRAFASAVRFALSEAEIVMAELLSRYEIRPLDARPVLPIGLITIEPSYEPYFQLEAVYAHNLGG